MSAALIRKLSQARERVAAQDATGAARLCQDVLARAPRNPDALCLLAITHLMHGRPGDAMPPLELALTVQPRHGAALENLGLAQLMLANFAAAERALAAASVLPGAPASVFMRLGVAILNQGRHPDARTMGEALQQKGVPAVFKEIVGATHDTAPSKAVADVFDFFAAHSK